MGLQFLQIFRFEYMLNFFCDKMLFIDSMYLGLGDEARTYRQLIAENLITRDLSYPKVSRDELDLKLTRYRKMTVISAWEGRVNVIF